MRNTYAQCTRNRMQLVIRRLIPVNIKANKTFTAVIELQQADATQFFRMASSYMCGKELLYCSPMLFPIDFCSCRQRNTGFEFYHNPSTY